MQPPWKTIRRFLRKLQIEFTTWSSNPTPGKISGQNYNSKRCMHLYVQSSAIQNSQDMGTTKHPSTDEWREKMWSIYTMDYCSIIEKSEITPFAATRVGLEMITLGEVSQKENDKCRMIPLNVEPKIWHKWTCLQNRNKSTDIEIRLLAAKGESGRGREGLGGWAEQMQTRVHRRDEQRGPTVEHQELASAPCNKP